MNKDPSDQPPAFDDVFEGVFCLDFEASSLDAAGYPIEVGLAEVKTNRASAWLIRPTARWREAGVWDKAAQALHGITPPDLDADGLDPALVALQLCDRLSGKRVLSDNPAFDERWLRQLYAAAGVGAPPFALADLATYAWHLVQTSGRLPHIAVRKAEMAACLAFPVRHRAGADAQHNAELLRQLRGAK